MSRIIARLLEKLSLRISHAAEWVDGVESSSVVQEWYDAWYDDQRKKFGNEAGPYLRWGKPVPWSEVEDNYCELN